MNVKRIYSLLTILLATVSAVYSADIFSAKDPLEKTYLKSQKKSASYQQQLIQSPSWQNFLAKNGKWYVEFNEATGMPHKATGKPIATNTVDPVEAGRVFLNELEGYNLPKEQLVFRNINRTKKYTNVFFKQQYKGIEVLFASYSVKLLSDNKVVAFSADVFNPKIETVPGLSADNAKANATDGLSGITSTSDAVVKILPVPSGKSVSYKLVYELTVSGKTGGMPFRYYTLVDANTGEIIYRRNKVKSANSDVTVKATVYKINLYQPSSEEPLADLEITDGATTVYTDSAGNASLTGTLPRNATFRLEGKWSQTVTDAQNISPVLSYALQSGNDTVRMDSATTIRHTSGYYHVTKIHDYMKSFLPSFTGLDFPLPTRIDVTGGTCNAFYTGADINFYATGGGCNCMSQIADVVYHEYGHGINDLFYQQQGGSFDNGGMGEGYADVWGMAIIEAPVIGLGYSSGNPAAFIRRYDVNRKVYPQDLTGQVHDDGEIIAGAWYDVALNLNSFQAMMQIFTETYFDLITGPDGTEGQVYTDILIAALNADDDDGDLTNGSPNFTAITNAFALHGITLGNAASVTHNPVLSSAASSPVNIDVNATVSFPGITIQLNLYYRTTNSGPYTPVPMTPNGSTYSAAIPGQPAGTIISYYIDQLDASLQSVKTLPSEANAADPNIPYFILVDCNRNWINDFDGNQDAGWLTTVTGDNANTGVWVIDVPVASFVSAGDTCQVGVQVTPGGTRCAVTGNSPSVFDPIGNNDVDGGRTTLQSPAIDISTVSDPIVTYWRHYSNDQGSTPRTDFWQTYISGDGVNFVRVENLDVPDHDWRRFAFKVSDYFTSLPSNITLRFVAEDATPGSLIEAAVDEIEVYSGSTTTAINPVAENNFSVYPNPANDFVTIDFNEVKADKIEIVNVAGENVYSQKVDSRNIRISTQQFSNGIYFIIANTNAGPLMKKFSVSK